MNKPSFLPKEDVRLIVLDLDGTLLDSSGTVPPGNMHALCEAARRGIHLAFCSGRFPDDISYFASRFPSEISKSISILALNGSCALESPYGPLLWTQHIAGDDVRRSVSILREAKCVYALFCDHDLFVHEIERGVFTDDFYWGSHMTDPPSRTCIWRDRGEDMLISRGVSKIVALDVQDPDRLHDVQRRIESMLPHLEYSSSWRGNFEINPPSIHKGYAVESLARRLQLPLSTVMAVGDQTNDLPMLRSAGIPVAMGNAPEMVRKVCRYLTLDHDACGVQAAVEALALHIAQPYGTLLPL